MMAEPDFLNDPDLRESPALRRLFDHLGKSINPRLLARVARRLEGGDLRSRTLRRILWHRYEVRAEVFSYGGFHEPGACEPGLSVGRYASVSRDARWGLPHPLDHIALSPVFAQPENGFTEHWPFERPTLEIGADAWIGAHSVIVSGCRRIGIGAVIGAGSVVTKDVPDFAIVVGAPARIVRYRFGEELREAILRSRWWTYSPEKLRRLKQVFTAPLDQPHLVELLAALDASAANKEAERTGQIPSADASPSH